VLQRRRRASVRASFGPAPSVPNVRLATSYPGLAGCARAMPPT
jgi:hypothetical protein